MPITPLPLTVIAMLVASFLLACESRVARGPTTATPIDQPAPSPPAAEAPQLVFADDFESGSLAAWPDGVDPARHRIVTDPQTAQSGDRYLAVTFPRGNDGGWLTRFFMPGYGELYASYHVRFPNDWRGGTKLIAFYGSRIDDQWSALGKAGLCPNGTDFFAAMLVTEPDADPGSTRFYSYYPGMAREPDGVTCWGRYGNGSERYASLAPLGRGLWHHVELSVRLNDPGERNGHQTFWVDGREHGSWSGLSFGDTRVLRLNAVQLTFSVSGGVPREQQLHVDNLVVRTSR